MKTLTGFVFILSVITTSVSAQEFYFRAGGGYAFPQAGQTIDGTGQPYNGTQSNSTYLTTYNLKAASFSSGVQGVFGLGYLFNDHIGVQLDASIGLSNTQYTYTDHNVQLNGVLGDVSIIQHAQSSVFIMPSLVLQTGGDPWNIYCRMGLALPLSSKITQDEVLTNAPGTGATTVDDFTLQLTNSFSLGFTAAAGVKYKLNDRTSIWLEASLLSSSLFIKQADLVNASENGQNIPLSAISGPQTVKYSKSVSVDTTGTMQPTYSQPFSNIALQFGVCFTLSHHSHRAARRNEDEEGGRPRGGSFRR